jgi:CheY-like chemotaxis protein
VSGWFQSMSPKASSTSKNGEVLCLVLNFFDCPALIAFMNSEPAEKKEPVSSKATIADILLVEDDAIHAALTLQALTRCNLRNRVEHVADGAEALDYVNSATLFSGKAAPLPKLILLDLGLHKMGGLQVLRQLKSNDRTKSIPVVVLTSSTMAIELMESYKLGVNSYVIKPSDPKKFAEAVAGIANYWLTINEPPPA